MVQSDAHLTGYEVAGSIPTMSGNIFMWDHEIISMLSLSLPLIQECAQVLVNHLED